VGLFAGGIVLYLPFWIGLQSQASGLLPNLFNPTRPVQFFVMFGPLLTISVGVLVRHLRTWQVPVRGYVKALLLSIAVVILVVVLFAGVAVLLGELGRLPTEGPYGYLSGWLEERRLSLSGTGDDVYDAAAARLRMRPLASGTAVSLLSMIVAAAVALARPARENPLANRTHSRPAQSVPDFAALLIALGALLSFVVEFVYLSDVFGTRMNTVFKFYFQTWVMWALASAYGLATVNAPVDNDREAVHRRRTTRRTLRRLGTAAAALLVACGMVYPPLAISARAREYGGPPTLDGAAHLAERDVGDYQAIEWLNQNVPGAPVVLEAHGGSYEYAARVSAHTGLPTVLGWPGHERQWRGGTRLQAGRAEAIEAIYGARDEETVLTLLDAYDVRYIVIGALERSKYASAGLDRLAAMLSPVFSGGGTTIYERMAIGMAP
jgi:YYY domain-containing protein